MPLINNRVPSEKTTTRKPKISAALPNIEFGRDIIDGTGTESDEDTFDIPDDIKQSLDNQPSSTTTVIANPSTKKNGKGAKSSQKSTINATGRQLTAAIISEALISGGTAEAQPPKKRGRRRKLPIDQRFGNNDYIIMWPIICEDQRFLTDRYENIYSNNPEHPVFIGIREVGGRINRTAHPKCF